VQGCGTQKLPSGIEGQPPAEERFITARFAAMVQRSFVRGPRKEAERFLSAQGVVVSFGLLGGGGLARVGRQVLTA